MTKDQIKHMVDRFLGWRLPESFNPDGGISFKKIFNDHLPHPMKHEPSGTNLLDAVQADAMVRYMVDGIPPIDTSSIPQRLYDSEINFSISCFWDGGFTVKLGDYMNGFVAENNIYDFDKVLEWLDREARERFPKSFYATGIR